MANLFCAYCGAERALIGWSRTTPFCHVNNIRTISNDRAVRAESGRLLSGKWPWTLVVHQVGLLNWKLWLCVCCTVYRKSRERHDYTQRRDPSFCPTDNVPVTKKNILPLASCVPSSWPQPPTPMRRRAKTAGGRSGSGELIVFLSLCDGSLVRWIPIFSLTIEVSKNFQRFGEDPGRYFTVTTIFVFFSSCRIAIKSRQELQLSIRTHSTTDLTLFAQKQKKVLATRLLPFKSIEKCLALPLPIHLRCAVIVSFFSLSCCWSSS